MLEFADSLDIQQLIRRFRLDAAHVAQGGVGKDEVGRDLFAGGDFLAQGAQMVEQFRRCRLFFRFGFREGLKDFFLSPQHGIGGGF